MASALLVLASGTDLPFFHLGALDIGIPIQWFGMIVAAGVMIGAVLLRRYAEWHGISDDHIRGLLTWVIVSGFLGAHEFDMLAYNFDKIGETMTNQPASWWFLPDGLWPSNWPMPLRIWDGISSYGGFIGGAIGFALYVWWKRLPAPLLADTTIVGLLPAFSIGRIGCTVVSDHIGATVDPSSPWTFFAMPYPSEMLNQAPGKTILAWNLGFVELVYLIPVNIVFLWLAFRTSKRMPAGFITVLTGVLYAPVRFFIDFLRPDRTDPRYGGLTFAQWASILAFGVAIYAAVRILRRGTPAEVVAATSGEAQRRLKSLGVDDQVEQTKQEASRKAEAERKAAELARLRAERDREYAEEVAAVKAAATAAVNAPAAGADDEAGDDDHAEATAAAPPAAGAPAAAKPAAAKPAGGKPSGNKSRNKNRKR